MINNIIKLFHNDFVLMFLSAGDTYCTYINFMFIHRQ